MQRSDSLRRVLTDLSRVYNEGEKVPVEFATAEEGSRASPDGTVYVANDVRGTVGRELSGPNELRVIVNTLSHEVEHVRETVLTNKRSFADAYPACPDLAGAVINILEDQYIDHTRTNRFRGLRRSQAFVVDMLMSNDNRRPPIDTLAEESIGRALLEGLLQVAFAGTAKGIADAPDEVRECLARLRPIVEATRTEPDTDVREANAHRAVRIMLGYMDEDEAEAANQMAGEGDMPADAVPGDGDGDGDGETEQTDVRVLDTQFGPTADEDDIDPVDAPGELSADDIDAIEDALGEMDDADGAGGGAGSWYGLGDGEDYHDPSQMDARRYERLQDKLDRDEHGVDVMRDARRDRPAGPIVPHAEVQAALREDDLDKRIEDAFRELKTRDHPEPRRTGQRVNTRAYTRMLGGNQAARRELYHHRENVELGDRAVHVCLDLSGSMPEKRAKTALAAIWTATDAIGDDFSANAFRTGVDDVRGPDGYTALITAPDEPFEWSHLDTVWASGATPTASGVQAATGILRTAAKPSKLMIVITDGNANRNLDGAKRDASEDARATVAAARSEGMAVIGLAVGRVTESMMRDVFGPDGYLRTTMDDLTPTLIGIYNRQMRTGRASV